MKSLSSSSLHANLERMTAKKEPQRHYEDSTDRKKLKAEEILELLQRRKRLITTEEATVKQSVREVLLRSNELMRDL
jgi:hypothetical protein